MTERVIIAGSGGQGIMLVGRILAQSCMRENKFVTWLPCYGAEVRGGTAYCMIVISDAEIGSPYIDKADTLIIMNRPSFERFKHKLKNKGLLVINSSLVKQNIDKNAQILRYPFTDIAIKLGNIKVANIVALGCLIAHKPLASLKSISKVISDIAPEEKKHLIEVNIKALKEGVTLK